MSEIYDAAAEIREALCDQTKAAEFIAGRLVGVIDTLEELTAGLRGVESALLRDGPYLAAIAAGVRDISDVLHAHYYERAKDDTAGADEAQDARYAIPRPITTHNDFAFNPSAGGVYGKGAGE